MKFPTCIQPVRLFIQVSCLLALGLFFPTQVWALPGARSYTNVTTGDVFLGGNFIEVGISKYGSFGTSTGQSKPAGFYGSGGRNNIGMSSNAAGFTVTPDTRIDYFLPGNPEERWAVGYKQSGSPTTASNAFLNGSMGVSDNVVTNQSSGDQLQATGVGTLNSRLKITQQITFSANDKYFKNTVTLENVSGADLDEVRYMRTFDPDNTSDRGGQSQTKNQIVYTHAAGDGKAVVMADTSNNNNDPVYLVNGSRSPILFYTSDSRARVSTFGFSNTNPYATSAYDTPKAKGTSETADQAITITVDVGTLNPGESQEFVYYTSLDNRDFSEVIEEIEEATSSNVAPDVPTALGPTSLVNGSATASAQPTLSFTLSDPNATNSAKFVVQVDNNSNFASPEVEYSSALAAQGSRSFTVGQAAGSGSYAVGSEGQSLANGSYYWRVKALDDFDSESAYAVANSGSVAFIVNTVTPETGAVSQTVASTSATVNWTTNDAASSQIEYGLVPTYGFATAIVNTSPMVSEHSVTIIGLKPCARYFYRTVSRNNAGVRTESQQQQLITLGCTQSTIEDGVENKIDKSTGGQLTTQLTRSEVVMNVPANFASQSASFQINTLNPSQVPTAPAQKSLAGVYIDLIAVADDETEITTFDEPLTVVISYDAEVESSYDESTLDLYYFDGSSWLPMGCTVDTEANTLTCELSHFSTYGMFGAVKQYATSAPPQPAPGRPDDPLCTAERPVGAPHLFQIDRAKTTVFLHFTPVSNANEFYISYAEHAGAEAHGTLVNLGREGVQSFLVEQLQPNVTYYFKVRANNGCMPGDWSNVFTSEPVQVKAASTPARDQVMTAVEEVEASPVLETSPQPSPTSQPAPAAEQTPSLWTRVKNWVSEKF